MTFLLDLFHLSLKIHIWIQLYKIYIFFGWIRFFFIFFLFLRVFSFFCYFGKCFLIIKFSQLSWFIALKYFLGSTTFSMCVNRGFWMCIANRNKQFQHFWVPFFFRLIKHKAIMSFLCLFLLLSCMSRSKLFCQHLYSAASCATAPLAGKMMRPDEVRWQSNVKFFRGKNALHLK